MNAVDIERLVDSLGIPAAILVFAGLFIWRVVWPWWVKQVDRWTAAMEQNNRYSERLLVALDAVADKIKALPNTQLADAVTKLIERQDTQHAQLLQRLEAHHADMVSRLDKIDTAVR